MPLKIKKIKGRYRLVEPNGKIATRNGSSIDGGGHGTEEKAKRQMKAININRRK